MSLNIAEFVHAKARDSPGSAARHDHLRGGAGGRVGRRSPRRKDRTRRGPGDAGALGQHRALSLREDRARRTYANARAGAEDRASIGLQFGRADERYGSQTAAEVDAAAEPTGLNEQTPTAGAPAVTDSQNHRSQDRGPDPSSGMPNRTTNDRHFKDS